MENTMLIITKAREGKFCNSLEKYHIFLISKQGIHMNECNIDNNNPMFEWIYQKLKNNSSSKQTLYIPYHFRLTYHDIYS